jgi:hypothetical protein
VNLNVASVDRFTPEHLCDRSDAQLVEFMKANSESDGPAFDEMVRRHYGRV